MKKRNFQKGDFEEGVVLGFEENNFTLGGKLEIVFLGSVPGVFSEKLS